MAITSFTTVPLTVATGTWLAPTAIQLGGYASATASTTTGLIYPARKS